MGMIWKAVDDDKVMAEGTALCARLAAMPTRALAAIRKALAAAETNSLSAQLDYERDTQEALSKEPDAREGISAFLEKRAPKFTGGAS
jgi:2-(1,2-epoxy-1,2-dihydrophenyl)acetyl-CoA isomerase